jgi:5-formyltetrahydrofolate cyclo-ligase
MFQNNRQPPDQPKASLRRELRNRRQGLPVGTRACFDKSINKHLLQMAVSQNFGSIAVYWPFNGEPDITPACKQLMASGCQLALPVISERGDFSMSFRLWQADTVLVKNSFGISEPQESTPISIHDFDMLVMPLVGYDLCGNRLGIGAGYYDRHLESLRESPAPLRVGLAYSLQEVSPIKENNWDIPLHGVVNELGWFTFVSGVP